MCPSVDTKHLFCSITVQGPLNDAWADYLGALHQDVTLEDGQIIATTVSGQPIDLLAYIGMLTVVASWGFSVIATEYRLTVPLD
jgi:hypothetical protein